MKNFIKQLVESGVRESDDASSRRGIIFSNYIALIFCLVNIPLFLATPQNRAFTELDDALISLSIFAFPILLNRFSFTGLSKLYLCWVPPMLVTWMMVNGMMAARTVPVSTYYGLRIYLVATGCIPYLLMDRKHPAMFILGVVPTLFILTFFDYYLRLLGVPVEALGQGMTPVRSFIAYLVVGGSCFALRYVVDKTDGLNQKLIDELEQKNKIIQQNAQGEVNQLNQQLRLNLDALMKREEILKKSQNIAKVGSWELDLDTNQTYWSDQVYDIFGVHKDFDLNSPMLIRTLFNESGQIVESALQDLIATGKSYDFTLQARTPLGYVKWVRIFGFPLYTDDKITGVSGIVHDVTFFKESEERARASAKNYQSLFEQASDAIVLTDMKGKIIDVNSAMVTLAGYEKDELIRLTLTDILDPEQLKDNPLSFQRLSLGEQVFANRRVVRQDGSTVEVEVNAKMVAENRIMGIARNISERIQIEKEREYAKHMLRERIKELTVLYRAGQILAQEQKTVPELLQEIVAVIPSGWQYPSLCAARITYGGNVFETSNFKATPFLLSSEFNEAETEKGLIEVVYLEPTDEEVEGPFLFEERNLIDALADMLDHYVARRKKEEDLFTSQANLRSTINNTEVLIWSVDREFKLLTFNEPFYHFIKNSFNNEISIGARVLDTLKTPENDIAQKRWEQNYLRSLSGEVVSLEETIAGVDLKYSLSPIIERDRIIGVSAFADNVTDRNIRDRALAVANKQIGELRLTALRSVMNPHFIFNALNSVQYFITKNDRLNALNYLSTFSKLIRGILTTSVSNTIKLSEELELLKHYINLEILRFENKFTFQISIDPRLDLDSIEIPSLLVQPYVENAILHGLYNKSEAGMLTISVKEVENAVLFEIEDNGIGREAAAKVKAQNFPKHKSMGTALTEERLRLINDYNNVSLETLDLMDEEKPVGTRVRIWIKV